MKVLVAADMEGISGVTHWEETDPTHKDYERFRRIMTGEVNAAVAGVFDGGADECVVTDGHGDGNNLLMEDMDARVKVNLGNASPFSMIQGVDAETSGVIFVGYHARAGSLNAVLAHTWSSSRIANVWLNGTLVGEYGLNAAVAGQHGVPVIMITGDQTACLQAEELLGSLEKVIVKHATSFFSAECMSPQTTVPMIRTAAKRAVNNLLEGRHPKPFQVNQPVKVTVELRQPEFADRVQRMPGVTRLDGVRVEFTIEDMLTAHAAFRAAVKISME